MYVPTYMRCICLLAFLSCFTGELPKQLPVSLKVLILGEDSSNTNYFTGGIPPEWGALTNLKQLKMVACGLGGEICMPQHTCTVCLLPFALVLQVNCPSSSQFHSRCSTLAAASATLTSSPVESHLSGAPLPISSSSRWSHAVSAVRFVCSRRHVLCVC